MTGQIVVGEAMRILHFVRGMRLKPGTFKWVGVVACVLLVCGWIGTSWSTFGYQTSTVSIGLWGGCFETSVYPAGLPTQGWFASGHPYEAYWLTRFFHGRLLGVQTTHLFVPLWIPLVVVGFVSIALWRHDRRRPPGHCQKCGYDLTGNTSGACPECDGTVASGVVGGV